MELNTINKTGTWSETADRINSNFSKISIEVEEIKQNGGGGSGGGGDVTNADHATSAYTLDKNTPVLDWFLSALYKPQNKMFRFYKTFCSKITLVNTIQNVI